MEKFGDSTSKECNLDNKYDIVAGPVDVDDMAMLLRQYDNQWIDFETLMRGMTYKRITSQYSFHIEKALCLFEKVGILNE